ncbi:MAG: DUF1273 domain-containing protein [Alistipes sp.]|jgi:uncharacterized phage-like protein YoqJ|nr:DUF1273 domain-containing protein [Alistipes sp.]
MTNERNTLCFSGHRDYVAGSDDGARLAEAVAEAWREGYRTFISGMAPGFDLAAAEAVMELKERRPDVRLVAAVPFAGQPRGYSPGDAARYESLLAGADEVCVLSPRYFHGCYYRRDEWMVDRSGRIVCWYDPTRRSSGTRYTVRHAVARGLQVVNLFRAEGVLF